MNKSQSIQFSEAEILEALRASAREELRFFSNTGKEAREHWVVSEFLTCQKILFTKDELHSPAQSSKIDVEFRDARFQIKEILNPGTRRYRDVEVKYERLLAAKNIKDIEWPAFIYEIPLITTIYNLIATEAYSLSINRNYSKVKAGLDLLFYVTRTHASLIQRRDIDPEYLSSLGWRSISCLTGNQATVLFASRDAPEFFRTMQMGD